MSMATELLAKSRSKQVPEPPTVAEHCRDVRAAAEVIWKSIEADLAQSLGMDTATLRTKLLTLYRAAALLHDIGKANDSFQKMIENPAVAKRQPVRHEILSAIAIERPDILGNWLSKRLEKEDRGILSWMVAGHHLKIRESKDGEGEDPLFRTAGTPKEVTYYLGHEQVKEVLRELLLILRSDDGDVSLPRLASTTLSAMEGDVDGLESWLRAFVRRSKASWAVVQASESTRLRLALLKALLIAADVAGSALVAEEQAPENWIPEKLAARVTPEALQPVIDGNLKGKNPYPFQMRVAGSDKPATLVMAGCGNGKTTAAYMWAQKWAKGRKLFFTYPTTGTASAGFEDYLLAQNQLARDLIHGRAWVDLRAMRENPDDDATATADRLESLSAWGCQVIACTVDTVLGLIQNQTRPLFSFPAIACGAFVFDEIHSYDRRLFSELLMFLRTFPGAPVLLMSASIPPDRLAAIREVLGDRLGEVINGDGALENIERYRVEMRPHANACWPDVGAALAPGSTKKVLWVCNTVSDAQAIYREAIQKRGIPAESVLLYHSRYRYKDRVETQDKLIRRFDQSGPCLAITTQVCEMSLDISADLLVTALAPLPALVQRLGRLNRRAEKDDAWPCLVYPFTGKPYDTKEAISQMRAATNMIREMAGKPYRQSDLAAYLKKMGAERETGHQHDRPDDLYSAWLCGGWQSEPLPAREGESSVTVIREEDLEEIQKVSGMGDPKKWNARNLVPWTVPILANGFRTDRRAGPYPLAARGSVPYDEVEGVQ
jgi:CRISPR-associated endonuclease/helicase Cas3